MAGSGSGGDTRGKWYLTAPFIACLIIRVFVTDAGLATLALVLTGAVAAIAWVTDAGFADSDKADERHRNGIARNRALQEQRGPWFWRRLEPLEVPKMSASFHELSGASWGKPDKP